MAGDDAPRPSRQPLAPTVGDNRGFELAVRPNGSARIHCVQCGWDGKARTTEAALALWADHGCPASRVNPRTEAAGRDSDGRSILAQPG